MEVGREEERGALEIQPSVNVRSLEWVRDRVEGRETDVEGSFQRRNVILSAAECKMKCAK